ncbi:MAG: S1/P1 nuclease [Bryobacteraceae bacterium]
MRVLLALALAHCALAWNGVGHRAVAGLAYDQLTPAARARVDELIRRHPDYSMLTAGTPEDPAQRARYAFMKAAFWPDIIKGDPRFYDESRRDAVAPAKAEGFADMKQRRNWHYINVAFSTDGTVVPQAPAVNVLSQVKLILERIGGEAAKPGTVEAERDPIYLLPWLVHLVGDVHQPLHCATRYKRDQVDPATGKPWSDLGGNTVFVQGSGNLHAFWDDALGITDTNGYVDGLIKVLAKRTPEGVDVLTPKAWVDEGFEIARSFVYSFGNEGGSKENPIVLGDEYSMKAREIARQRAALAGARLARLLNERFR